ncbi:MAG: protein-L-isoaspartate O-methyltransferase [Candidatus Aminicenantes bacterium RBG_19FT_COMBO_58_17]|jgi:protein-L-isoaspartate(D-aspartate) O-methyltransferase|nr:MAG: protein-L-isoaspartate O-methyltransferase [Candidatus Aminicenantes bacterium RBG_19FT_COMBO_58_17]
MADPEDDFITQRETMVEVQIRARGVNDEKVLAAMRKVPRHLFVPQKIRPFAHGDEPLPIGEGQTISQPYIVAYMTQALELTGKEKVLEVGTGSGYQTAVLAEIVRQVFTVELLSALSDRARALLQELGYTDIHYKVGDGTSGWEENAPFDAIIVTAAAPAVPKRLQDQLSPDGRMIIPVGAGFQDLFLISRERRGFRKKKLLPVRFVPLISAH